MEEINKNKQQEEQKKRLREYTDRIAASLKRKAGQKHD